MADDIKKSFSSILYERTTSPFFGTLIISWIIWNWRIVYLTLFISESRIVGNKIDYIIANYSETHRLITFPLLSALVLLTLVPFVSNGAYWLFLIFIKWKQDKKKSVNKMQLITLEQSIELREQISLQEERFEKLLENKNLEIKQLKLMLENSKIESVKPNIVVNNSNDVSHSELIALAKRIKSNPQEMKEYESVLQYTQGGHPVSSSSVITPKFLVLLEANGVVKNTGKGIYQFTESGNKFNKLMI